MPEQLDTASPGLLSPADVAKKFGVSRNTVYRWLNSGELPSIKIGGTVRVPAPLLLDRLQRSRISRTGRF